MWARCGLLYVRLPLCDTADADTDLVLVEPGGIFDLTRNTQLRSLTFKLTEGDPLIWILASLQALPSSLLQSLTIQQPAFKAPNVQTLRDLDDLLSDTSRFGQLLTVKFVLLVGDRPTYAAKVFPKLVKRNMLDFEN